MSYDEQPDGDPHGECAAEIHRLEAERDAQIQFAFLAAQERDALRILLRDIRPIVRVAVDLLHDQPKFRDTPIKALKAIDAALREGK